jgi:ABC-type Zn uptake system ZnuABC Zn-binding protein ZnuA
VTILRAADSVSAMQTGGSARRARTGNRTSGALSVALAAGLIVGCGDDSARSQVQVANATAKAAVAAFACPVDTPTAGQAPAAPGDSKLQVVTTVAPITSIVANIAGDRAEVTGVIPEGEDSHTYEPKPSVAKIMAAADLVLVNGLKLEDPTRELAQQNIADTARIVELGTTALREDQYLYDFSFPKDAGKPNPHLWTNPPMARCYAQIAASAMTDADPANADYYRANFDRYAARLDELDRLFAAASKAMTPQQRTLLTYHDAYAYFAARYDWTVIGAIQVSNFEEPTPKEVAALIDQVKQRKVPAIFGSEVFPSPVLAQIGKEAGVRYVDSLRDDDLPGSPGEGQHSFLGLMKFDFVTMLDALGGDSAAVAIFDPSDTAPDQASYPQ